MEWYPHVTVATVIENKGRFLVVEEFADGEIVINQPAGHLDEGETLIDAAIRETLEETRWLCEPTAIVDISLYRSAANNTAYYRTTFAAKAVKECLDRELEADIKQVLWLSLEELRCGDYLLRSPMVTYVIERYLHGKHYPLDLISHHS